MSADDSLEERIARLEMRIAYQDQTIEDLNQALTAQWKVIEDLRRQLTRLGEELAETAAGADGSPQDEPPPPHY
jgi:SlyX protein